MKIPEYIKKEIKKCADLSKKLEISNCTIANWINQKTKDKSDILGSGMVEYLGSGTASDADAFIELLENYKED